MSKNLFIFSLLLVLIIGIASADDIPLKPHEFYGTVTINGAPHLSVRPSSRKCGEPPMARSLQYPLVLMEVPDPSIAG